MQRFHALQVFERAGPSHAIASLVLLAIALTARCFRRPKGIPFATGMTVIAIALLFWVWQSAESDFCFGYRPFFPFLKLTLILALLATYEILRLVVLKVRTRRTSHH